MQPSPWSQTELWLSYPCVCAACVPVSPLWAEAIWHKHEPYSTNSVVVASALLNLQQLTKEKLIYHSDCIIVARKAGDICLLGLLSVFSFRSSCSHSKRIRCAEVHRCYMGRAPSLNVFKAKNFLASSAELSEVFIFDCTGFAATPSVEWDANTFIDRMVTPTTVHVKWLNAFLHWVCTCILVNQTNKE